MWRAFLGSCGSRDKGGNLGLSCQAPFTCQRSKRYGATAIQIADRRSVRASGALVLWAVSRSSLRRGASLNHGNCSNGRKTSSSSSVTQIPFLETQVIATRWAFSSAGSFILLSFSCCALATPGEPWHPCDKPEPRSGSLVAAVSRGFADALRQSHRPTHRFPPPRRRCRNRSRPCG